ncbi:fungal pheromone STE3G-protein-coupled receptor [Peniophora sp. CONT]|nr:fungal pheromone STE3G-protein-coupled receptor [Peniophora sp. CONT]
MAAAVDPTYPLYPIACILSAIMLLLVFLTSFIRRNWNLGVALLCFWLFWENLTYGINAIIWSDNTDIKLYIYCDIVSHMQLITSVVKPMATLIITRRLYLITSLRSVEVPDKTAVCAVGPFCKSFSSSELLVCALKAAQDYIVQGVRFDVHEGFGCGNNPNDSLLGILLIFSWTVAPPLLSITIYYPRLIRIFYRQKRDMNEFLQSNNSVSRVNYFRIFALASIDVFLTLPIGIVTIVLQATQVLAVLGKFPLYAGWTILHTDWEPVGISYAELLADGTSTIAQNYFTLWTSPVLAFVIFGLFGVTTEARASYWRAICTVGGWFGWKPTLRTRKARSPIGTMEFGERPQDMSYNLDIE